MSCNVLGVGHCHTCKAFPSVFEGHLRSRIFMKKIIMCNLEKKLYIYKVPTIHYENFKNIYA